MAAGFLTLIQVIALTTPVTILPVSRPHSSQTERDRAAMRQTGVPELAGAIAALSAREGTRACDR
jgi:hypothetical protein